MNSFKSAVLVEAALALFIGSVLTTIGMFFGAKMSIGVAISGFILAVICIFGVMYSKSAAARKLMLWYVASFMLFCCSTKLAAASVTAIMMAAIITAFLIAAANAFYTRFSVTSLCMFSLIGVFGVLALSIFGVQGILFSILGAAVFFGCIMADFATLEDHDNPEAAAMSLVTSVVNLFSFILDICSFKFWD